MPRSTTYKLAKVSAPQKQIHGLFDQRSDNPGELIAQAILLNPRTLATDGERVAAAVFKAQRIDDGVIEGDFAREGSVDWPHIETNSATDEPVLTDAILEAMPYCHFYYDEASQVAAFQSSKMNKSFPKMLMAWDRLLAAHVGDFGRDVHSIPLQDETPFLTTLQNAKRVFSVTFYMVPPNGYTNQRVRQTIAYVSEATEAREVAIKVDAAKGGSIRPDAAPIREMAVECAAGNGVAQAPIMDAAGNLRTVSTKTSPIVRQLADRGVDGVKRLLKWASDTVVK